MFIVHVHCSLFMFIVHCSHGATLIFDDVFKQDFTTRTLQMILPVVSHAKLVEKYEVNICNVWVKVEAGLLVSEPEDV